MLKPLPPPWDRFVPFVQRLTVWLGFFTILWFLRPFFFLVFLTFVFGYVLEHLVELLEKRIRSRRTRVIGGFLVLLSILVGIGFVVAPELRRQVVTLPTEMSAKVKDVDAKLLELRERHEFFHKILPENFSSKDILSEFFMFSSTGSGDATASPQPVEHPSKEESSDVFRSILPFMLRILQGSVAVGSSFLLSLLFSFLIVLDLPNLANGARHLRDTRLRFVYDEVSDNVFRFGRVLGRALEAQLMIAIANTALTAVGLNLMGIPNIASLATIVFICSFIPVAGVFISSVPICLLTLTSKEGFIWVVYVILFITLIHLIEAYILNPRIYGAHLKMNPVLVLSILVISHHLFGMWGLVLGVPVTTYVYKHVICGRQRDDEEDDLPAREVPLE